MGWKSVCGISLEWSTVHITCGNSEVPDLGPASLCSASLGCGTKCSLRFLLICTFLWNLSGVYLEITTSNDVPVSLKFCSPFLHKVIYLVEADTEITKTKTKNKSQTPSKMLVIMLLIVGRRSELVYYKSAQCLCEQTGHQKCCNNWFHLTQKATAARTSVGLGRNKVGQSFLWRPMHSAVCLTISLKCFCSSVGGNLLLGLSVLLKNAIWICFP